MRNNIFKKLIVFALAFVMVVTYIPLTDSNVPVASAASGLKIYYDGEPCDELTVVQNESETLTAKGAPDNAKYQWQVKINGTKDSWANIRGTKDDRCDITYALVGSMLDDSGIAYVRCVAKRGETEYISEPVAITISYNVSSSTDTTDNENNNTPTNNSVKIRGTAGKFALTKAASEYVTITIEYMFEGTNGKPNLPAFDPYIASLKSGTDFKTEVPSPTILGYNAYVKQGSEYVEANSISLDYKGISENQTITVLYRPAEVGYKVRYFLQNVGDDMYTEDVSLMAEATGFTGDYPRPELVKRTIDGFNALYYQPEIIAADGSTEFQCYYDRNYYLINFDLNGGFGVDPLYARYQTPFVVNTPVKPGYVFGGWDLQKADGTYDGVKDTMVSTIPDKNLTYRAIWNAVQTTYTVVYWRENADDTNYSYWGSRQVNAMSATTVSGSDDVPASIHTSNGVNERNYFTFNPVMTDKNIIVEGDGSTIVNVYYTRNYYTITFKAPGACTLDVHSHGDGKCEYQYLCEVGSHTHTAECLSCGLEGHIHDNDCCNLVEHKHSAANGCQLKCQHVCDAYCYGATGEATPNTNRLNAIKAIGNSEPQNGYTYRIDEPGWMGGTTSTYYLYFDGKWYSTTQNATTGNSLGTGEYTTTSGWVSTTYTARKYAVVNSCKHSHDDSCYYCSTPTHAHDGDSCDYSDCTQHVHKSSCYGKCPADGHTHTSTCYGDCIKPTHSHGSNCTNSSRENTVKSVTRKYGASLRDIWPVVDGNGNVYNNGERWSPSSSSFYSQVLVYLDIMPADDFTLTLNKQNYDTFNMHYYLESIDGKGAYNKNYNDQTKNFNLEFSVSANYNYLTKDEDFFDIKGFKQWTSTPTFGNNGQLDINGGGDVHMYYERLKYNLQYYNVSQIVETKSGVPYDAPLENYKIDEPSYPSTLEPNAYYFEGWYTTPQCFAGTKVDFSKETMPDGDLALYANWAPEERTVRFYQQYSDITDSEDNDQIAQFTADHGKVLPISADIVVTPPAAERVFAGWFYMKDGEKVAFNPYEMVVKADLDVFAEWTSSVASKYEIRYVDDATGDEIAPPLTGITFAGQTKTFAAKNGTELNEGYRTGYFPKTNSHSIVIDEDEANNKYTFRYVKLEEVPYTVRYVNKQTGEVWDTVVKQNLDADNKRLTVITEKFRPYAGYVPDAYYKRLVLSATPSENVITFYYLEDNEHAYYVVYHKVQELNGTYSDYAVIEGIGDLNTKITATPLKITGFEHNASIPGTKLEGTLTLDGLELYVYYTRKLLDYKVKYLEYGTTDTAVLPEKTVEDQMYGATVTETAPMEVKKDGNTYELVGDPPNPVREYEIRDGENVITFYYKLRQYTIKYEAVCTEPAATDFGSVTFSQQIVNNSSQITGSTADPEEHYEFVGWYSDPDCENLITTDAFLLPTELKDWTYYALFKPIITELTIEKTGVSSSDLNQSFIFNVKGIGSNAYIDMDVVITGNGTKVISDVPEGEYRITEKTDWSWRYNVNTPSTGAVELTAKNGKENRAEFYNRPKNLTWLGGEVIKPNKFN